jgi:putative salt-induced outer membrane protein
MSGRREGAATFCLLTLLAVPVLRAQEKPPRSRQLQLDFGLVNTAGNTSTTTLNAGEQGSFLMGAWGIAQEFSVLYGTTEGKKSAESYMAMLRGDYALSNRFGLYLLGGWDRNRFAGISRRFEEGAGLSFKAVTTARTTLSIEAGLSQTQQRDLAGNSNNFAGGRGALSFKQLLNTKAYFQELGEILPNFKHGEDVRIGSETSLVAPLSASIALKVGYVVRFDNDPEPGFKKTDRSLTSGLQIVF